MEESGLRWDWIKGRGPSRRTFSDPAHDTAENAAVWKGAFGHELPEPEALLQILRKAKGTLRLVNAKGRPAQTGLAKAAAKRLESDAAFKSRLILAQSDPAPLFGGQQDGQAKPGQGFVAKDQIEYLGMLEWAACAMPQRAAEAARAWAKESIAARSWWNNPFFGKGWDGRTRLLGPLRRLLAAQGDPEMQESMDRICSALLAGCLAEHAQHHLKCARSRMEGKRAWGRTSEGAGFSWLSDAVEDSARKERIMEGAARELLPEELRGNPELLEEAARMALLGASDSYFPGALGMVWARARSLGLEQIPLGPHDRMRPEDLLACAGSLDAQKFGLWLAQNGSRWSMPARFEWGPARGGRITESEAWGQGGGEDAFGMSQWSLLEHLVARGRGDCARDAAKAGANLSPGLAQALDFSKRTLGAGARAGEEQKLEQALAWAQACELAAASRQAADGQPGCAKPKGL